MVVGIKNNFMEVYQKILYVNIGGSIVLAKFKIKGFLLLIGEVGFNNLPPEGKRLC